MKFMKESATRLDRLKPQVTVDATMGQAIEDAEVAKKKHEDDFKELNKTADKFVKENEYREKPEKIKDNTANKGMKKMHLSEQLFEADDKKKNKGYKMGKVEDLNKDVYTFVYDCLFDGTHNYIPNIVVGDRFAPDKYVDTKNPHNIAVQVDNDSEANKVKAIADKLLLPFDYNESEGVATINLNSKTSKMPFEQFVDEMELDDVGYILVSTRNKKAKESLKESKDNEYYLNVARHFDHHIRHDVTEVIADLVDRAMVNIDESEDDDDDIYSAAADAIDEGLIYNEDIWKIKSTYESAELSESTYEELINDLVDIIKDIVE